MKMTLKHDNKIVDIKKPLVTPFQKLKDKIKICLVYVPNNCYYWLIDDYVNNNKNYHTITLNENPEKLEDLVNAQSSSLYTVLRMSIVNLMNELEIKDLKYELELAPDESITEDVFYNHIGYISEILYNEKENHIQNLMNEVGIFKDIITNGFEFIENEERKDLIKDLKINYDRRKNIGKSNLDLSFIITDYLKIGKHYISEFSYQLDEISNGYDYISDNYLHEQVNNLIGKNLVNKNDLITSLSHIVANLKPKYNMIKFKNGIYDYNKFELIQSEKSIFTLVNIDLNYVKNDYPTITDFLNSSLWQGNQKDTNKYVLGVKEILGYLFCSGNQDEIMIFMVGIPGSGKSTLTNLITEIFGIDNISDMKLQDPERDKHATASLLSKHLNIARDSDIKPVSNIGILKQIRGFDPMDVNPKSKPSVTIPKEEVPKFLLVSNNMPVFLNIDDAFIETAVFIKFKHIFRGTDKEKNYIHGFSESERGGLVYDCIKAYKDKKLNNRKFILQKDLEENKILFEMYSKPVHYMIDELVYFDEEISESDGEDKLYIDELNEMMIKLAKKQGLNITLNKNGQIDGKIMAKAYKDIFDLHNWKDQSGRTYGTKNDNKNANKRYYPHFYKKGTYWETLK
jgi:adenylate kinase family enzyme